MSETNRPILQIKKPSGSRLRPPRDVGLSQDWDPGLLGPRASCVTNFQLRGSPQGSVWLCPEREEGRELRHSWAARLEETGSVSPSTWTLSCPPRLLSQVKQQQRAQKQGSPRTK